MATTLLTNASVLTCSDSASDASLLHGTSVAVEADHIRWCGPAEDTPVAYRSLEPHDLQGRLVTPALIDCHTHIVHGGNRAWEFEERLHGVQYSEIARRGGGINATVSATRTASEDALLSDALRRVDALLAEGVGTLEIKSGYGLDHDTELRMLRVARRVAGEREVDVRTSFLGAHAVPPEFASEADAYIDRCCLPTLDAAAAAGIVDAVDGFCEHIAFTPAQIDRVFQRAVGLNLPVKLHAEQLSNFGGARLAAQYRALSVDHLEYLGTDDIAALRQAGTVAVLLPGAYYTLRETRKPPVKALRAAGVPMAVATDCNPGSSPLSSLLLAMNMACTLFGLTPHEALIGTTRHAAAALGLTDRGQIAPGQRANIAVWDVEHPAELAYRIGFNPLYRRMHAGRWVA